MASSPDLPPIELIAIDGEEVEVEPEDRPEVDRSRRRRNALIALGVLVVGLLVVGLMTREGPPPKPTLDEWAAEHHVGEPLSGISPPTSVTCNMDPYDFIAVANCMRVANERGLPASGHFMLDGNHPEAIDVWLTFEEDGPAVRVERVISAEPHPDPGVAKISPNSLKWVDTVWTSRSCRSVEFLADEGVFPGFECAYAPPPGLRGRAERSQSLTEEERDDLIRRFACTFPDIYTDEEC